MRIRKRFRLSCLSSLPLSDPQRNRSPVVQQAINGSTGFSREGNTEPQPSDPPIQRPPPLSIQPPTIGPGTPRWGEPNSIQDQDAKLKELENDQVEEDDGGRDQQEKSNDMIRKGIIFGAEAVSELLPSSSAASREQDGRWGEEDRVIPLKKRRGNFQIISFDDYPPESVTMEKEKKTTKLGKIKTLKRNKKMTQQLQNGNSDEQDGIKEAGDANHDMISTDIRGTCMRKPKKRGNVIMEGSRCSRVNGRGWRCFQQTLVGYSLCEHHLGKGRLRSMTSVRHAHKLSDASPVQEKETFLYDEEEDEDDHEKQLSTKKDKKMMKLGKVKARSISSLLGPNSLK